MKFTHLHCHTQYSLLDGASHIKKLINKAVEDDMPAIAITDHGNMYGVFEFVSEACSKGIKPIVGCEFYLVENRHKKNFTKDDKDIRYHQLLLAKNQEGYQNLSKLCSLGFLEGMYGKYPRIDKELILKYHKGLIATTCCLGAIVPKTILKKGEVEGEKEFLWWLSIFGEDFYVEIQRHNLKEQEIVNAILLKFAQKYGVKIIASNDCHYIDKQDAEAHDILLCVNTGEKKSTPSIKEFSDEDIIPRGARFAFPNNEFYFKNTKEMTNLFIDLPQAIDNTNEIVDKVNIPQIKREILLPKFDIPEEFRIHKTPIKENGNTLNPDDLNQWEYLKHLTYKGAQERYGEINDIIKERLDFELYTIKTMGFAGYFLIVSDFIKAGKDLGVFVGPGRGSAAGSVVAYCLGITNIDPIKYNLLFERFLNPDRKSMPDIDTDFDDEGRAKVIEYVVKKYGKERVAQIVTFNSMAAKSSIKDVARVLDMPLSQANDLAKLVSDKPGIKLSFLIHGPIRRKDTKDDNEKVLEEELSAEDLAKAIKLREYYNDENSFESKVLKQALVLEGSIRGTGVHAAGIIIAPHDLTDLIPMAVSKESDLYITQYEGNYIESAGVIKMDFLGLKTLTILKNTIKLIEKNHGIKIDINKIDLNDKKTFEIFQNGETDGVFQFESIGMKKYLQELKPDCFEDLIAMNALYRPGPLAYIPNYINRKHGREPITYDLEGMEEYLAETYGITVYQEQVMLLAQKLANFTKSDADMLRKAMGKKDRTTLDKLKSKFIQGATQKGHPLNKVEKVWSDWEAFASYAFNKSHSTCYAYVAFQTAYLKAHYPAEFLAANLTNEKDNIEKLTYFLEECKRLNIPVIGPNVNESDVFFNVNKKGEIVFGLGGIKGTGEAATQEIIKEREKSLFKDIYDFVERVNHKIINKKTMEALAQAGAFDCFKDIHRAQYFAKEGELSFIEKLIKYSNSYNELKIKTNLTLFDFSDKAIMAIPKPKPPDCTPWDDIT
jgi:DNA polymerase-3 subunit alpha